MLRFVRDLTERRFVTIVRHTRTYIYIFLTHTLQENEKLARIQTCLSPSFATNILTAVKWRQNSTECKILQ